MNSWNILEDVSVYVCCMQVSLHEETKSSNKKTFLNANKPTFFYKIVLVFTVKLLKENISFLYSVFYSGASKTCQTSKRNMFSGRNILTHFRPMFP